MKLKCLLVTPMWKVFGEFLRFSNLKLKRTHDTQSLPVGKIGARVLCARIHTILCCQTIRHHWLNSKIEIFILSPHNWTLSPSHSRPLRFGSCASHHTQSQTDTLTGLLAGWLVGWLFGWKRCDRITESVIYCTHAIRLLVQSLRPV